MAQALKLDIRHIARRALSMSLALAALGALTASPSSAYSGHEAAISRSPDTAVKLAVVGAFKVSGMSRDGRLIRLVVIRAERRSRVTVTCLTRCSGRESLARGRQRGRSFRVVLRLRRSLPIGARFEVRVAVRGKASRARRYRVRRLSLTPGRSYCYAKRGRRVRCKPPRSPRGAPAPPSVDPAPTPDPTSFSWASGDAYQALMGDFNDDGHVDVGLRRASDGRFYWRLGPTYSAQGEHHWSAAIGSKYQSFMGDFNDDGQVDVGVRRISDGHFYWRLGPGFSQGHHHWTAATGSNYDAFMGSFDGDSHVDVGVRRISDGEFYWRLGPSWSQDQHSWAAGSHFQPFMGDFNRDGLVDFGLRRVSNGLFYWQFGPGCCQGTYLDAPSDEYQSFMGDFNGDGHVDVGLRRVSSGQFSWVLGVAGG